MGQFVLGPPPKRSSDTDALAMRFRAKGEVPPASPRLWCTLRHAPPPPPRVPLRSPSPPPLPFDVVSAGDNTLIRATSDTLALEQGAGDATVEYGPFALIAISFICAAACRLC